MTDSNGIDYEAGSLSDPLSRAEVLDALERFYLSADGKPDMQALAELLDHLAAMLDKIDSTLDRVLAVVGMVETFGE